MSHVLWREKVAALKLQLMEEMRGQLTEHEMRIYHLCTLHGITDKNRDSLLDLLDRTMVAHERDTEKSAETQWFKGDDTEPCENCGQYFSAHGVGLRCVPAATADPASAPRAGSAVVGGGSESESER
jgi:hypothetical protein